MAGVRIKGERCSRDVHTTTRHRVEKKDASGRVKDNTMTAVYGSDYWGTESEDESVVFDERDGVVEDVANAVNEAVERDTDGRFVRVNGWKLLSVFVSLLFIVLVTTSIVVVQSKLGGGIAMENKHADVLIDVLQKVLAGTNESIAC